MKIARRGFLRVLSATPLAARAMAEQAAGQIAGISPNGLSGLGGVGASFPESSNAAPSPQEIEGALGVPANRRALLDLIYEEERVVNSIDPDLAVLRSFSLNAKICFQRQRNVERRLRQMTKGYPWRRLDALLRELTSK